MAVKILVIRERENKNEFVVYDDTLKEEFTFFRKDKETDEKTLTDYFSGILDLIILDRDAMAQEKEAINTEKSTDDFITWIDDNRDRKDISPYIEKLAEIYKSEK